jgi:hypothetical protein
MSGEDYYEEDEYAEEEEEEDDMDEYTAEDEIEEEDDSIQEDIPFHEGAACFFKSGGGFGHASPLFGNVGLLSSCG